MCAGLFAKVEAPLRSILEQASKFIFTCKSITAIKKLKYKSQAAHGSNIKWCIVCPSQM